MDTKKDMYWWTRKEHLYATKKYDEDFKKSIVTLFENGKTQSELSREYGVSLSAISRWIRLYSKVKTEDAKF